MSSLSQQQDWYTVAEVASRFNKTPQAVRIAADRGRLSHDVVLRGGRKERRFSKAQIDALERWPGYGPSYRGESPEVGLIAELRRLRKLTATLQQEVTEMSAGRAAAEMKIDELRRTVERQKRALRTLVDALTDDEVDGATLRDLLT